MKLYDIAQEQSQLLSAMIEIANNEEKLDYQIDFELKILQQTFNMLVGEKEDKILNIAKYIKNIRVDLQAFKDEKKRLSERQKVSENKIKSLEKFLLMNIETGDKFSDSQAKISWRKSKALKVDLDFEYPVIYQKPQPWKPDNARLKKDISSGTFESNKCRIVEKNNLQIK